MARGFASGIPRHPIQAIAECQHDVETLLTKNFMLIFFVDQLVKAYLEGYLPSRVL